MSTTQMTERTETVNGTPTLIRQYWSDALQSYVGRRQVWSDALQRWVG